MELHTVVEFAVHLVEVRAGLVVLRLNREKLGLDAFFDLEVFNMEHAKESLSACME
jgi:hypothetical protein